VRLVADVSLHMTSAEAEGEWMVGLDAGAKARFLAVLVHELTIAGRGSYIPQGDGLTNPELLRGINEIQHRVSACLSQLLSGDADVSFERSIAGWALTSSNEDVKAHSTTAWKAAKRSVGRAN
jgi:hypothetical protein